MLTVTVTRPAAPGAQVHHFTNSPVRIGRSPLNNLVLDDPWVSQHHGLVHFTGVEAHYSDLGSKNGTVIHRDDDSTLAARPSEQIEILSEGRRRVALLIGQVKMVVEWAGPAEEETANSELDERNRNLGSRLTVAHMRAVADELVGRPASGATPPRPSGGAVRRPTPIPAPLPAPAVSSVPVAPSPAVPSSETPSRRGYEPGRTFWVDGPVGRDELPGGPAPVASPAPAVPALSPPSVPAAQAVPASPASAEPPGAGYVAGQTRMVGLEESRSIVEGLKARAAAGDVAPPVAVTGHGEGVAVPPPGRAPAYGAILERVLGLWAHRAAWTVPSFDPTALAFVERLAAVVEALAQGLFELKRGLRDFGDGIGVRTLGSNSPLYTARSASELLAYLIDPRAAPGERLEQLVDLIADVMVHEFALLNGVKAGVRGLVDELDPEKGFAKADAGQAKAFSLFDRSLKRYVEHFRASTEDEGLSVVLGPRFVRAYAETVGDKAGTPRGSETPNRSR
jgi:predicted component of type VI protein secretion system